MKRLALLLPLLGLLFLLNGCGTPPDLSGVRVDLTKLERSSDGTLLATLRFSNATVRAVNIADSKHRITVNGRLVGQATVTEPIGLAPDGTASQTVPVSNAASIDGLHGSCSFRLDSEMKLLLYDEEKEIRKFAFSGTVALP